MENIYAAMLLHKAGKEIDEDSVTKVLTAPSRRVAVASYKFVHSEIIHHVVCGAEARLRSAS